MVELFRYIQQAFAVPADTGAIDVASDSDFQESLRGEEPVRPIASRFLDEHPFGEDTSTLRLRTRLLTFSTQLLELEDPGEAAVNRLVRTIFGADARTLIAGTDFIEDKKLLDDLLVAAKLVTGFDRVDAAKLVTLRRAVAYLEDLAAGKLSSFERPILIPREFIEALAPPPSEPPPPPPVAPGERLREALLLEQRFASSPHTRRSCRSSRGSWS
jgi:hypothetical protein